MKIASVAGVFPDHYYSQTVLLAALRRYWADRLANPMLLERLHRRVGVHGRYLALAVEDYDRLNTLIQYALVALFFTCGRVCRNEYRFLQQRIARRAPQGELGHLSGPLQ